MIVRANLLKMEKMMIEYKVKGFLDVRIHLDNVIKSSENTAPEALTEIVIKKVTSYIYSHYEIKHHELQIKGIGDSELRDTE